MLVLFAGFALAPPAHADELLIIANPSVGEEAACSLKEIASTYLLRVTLWPDGTHIVPVNRELGSEARQQFTSTVLREDNARLAAYWNQMHFQGKLPPLVQESEVAVLAFVQRVPGAVGYIRGSLPHEGVRVLCHVRER